MKLIPLDALVAEIERIKDEEIGIGLNAYEMGEENGKAEMCDKFLSFLNSLEVREIGVDLGDPKGDKSAKYIIDTKTLEVKEVDFGTEVYKYIDEHFNVYDDGNQTLQTKDKKSLIGRVDVEQIAEHFYELGLKAQKGE